MHEIANWIVDLVGQLGYIGIFIMMVIESSFFPFPSEVAMIPAGYLSSIGKMNFFIALIVGTFGAVVGASINYMLGKTLGGPIIKKIIHNYGKYILLNEKHYFSSEKYFLKHGIITTFIGRFIPAVRQLISIPAGVFKMNFGKFILFTGIGAFIWNLILMGIGYIAGENQQLIEQYSKEALVITVISIIIVVISYRVINKRYE